MVAAVKLRAKFVAMVESSWRRHECEGHQGREFRLPRRQHVSGSRGGARLFS